MDVSLQAPESGLEATPFSELRADPGRAGVESVLDEIAELRRIIALGLPEDLFVGVSPKVLQTYRRRAASEQPRELRMHPEPIRYTLMAAFCWQSIAGPTATALRSQTAGLGARPDRCPTVALRAGRPGRLGPFQG